MTESAEAWVTAESAVIGRLHDSVTTDEAMVFVDAYGDARAREATEGVLTAVLREVAERSRPDDTPEGVLSALEGIVGPTCGDEASRSWHVTLPTTFERGESVTLWAKRKQDGDVDYLFCGTNDRRANEATRDEVLALIGKQMGGN